MACRRAPSSPTNGSTLRLRVPSREIANIMLGSATRLRPSSTRRSSRRRNGSRRAGRRSAYDSDEWPTALIESRRDGRGPQRAILDVLERHGHDLGCPVDGDMTEELHAFAGWQVLSLLLAGRLDVADLRTERVVEVIGTERAGV